MTPLEKYLARHAEPEIALAGDLGAYDHVLCVPACGESPTFLNDVAPALDARVLTIIVVNGTAGDASAARANAEMLSALEAMPEQTPRLVIDRASPGCEVPAKQAVGLARKIAADVACAMFAAGKLTSTWIHMSDCDVVLPADYFAASGTDGVLLTYPFRHVPGGDDAIDRAHAIYDSFLRYYVLGLRAAGSPHAHHTIGSTLAVDVHAYAAVRGMPRRQAAEDFYLVNKISKLGRVVTPQCKPLDIVARRSLRVPFGTGRSTAKIAEEGGRAFYHPRVFQLVAHWLQGLERFAVAGDNPVEVALGSVDDTTDREVLGRALLTQGVEASLERALAAAPSNPAARLARAHEHFDAFRTRKLVHLLRDGGIGELPWRDALREAPFITVDPNVDPFAVSEAMASAEPQGGRDGARTDP